MKTRFTNRVINRLTVRNLAIQFVVGLLFSSLQVHAGNSWSAKKNVGGSARSSAAGFMIGTKGYIGTGTTAGTYGTKDFWEWDPSTNVWTQKADFGGGNRMGAVGFSIGSKGYIGTGSSSYLLSDNVNDFWQYDTSSNTWTKKTNYSGGVISNAVGFSIGGKAYIGTGAYLYGTAHTTSAFYEYDTANDSWSQKASFAGGARSDAVGFSIGTKGYIGTGFDGQYTKNDFYEYDPSSDKWTKKATFPGSSREDAVGFSIGSKGYLGVGNNGSIWNPYSDFYEYSQSANTWTTKTSYGTSLSFAVGFSNCTRGYIGTGADGPYSSNFYSTFMEYVPSVTPGAVISANKTELCPGGSVNFSDSSTNGPISWKWTFQGGTPSSSTSQNPGSVVYKNPGVYTVTLVASNQTCSSTASIKITVDSLPTITTSPQFPNICAGNSVLITPYGAFSYSWSPGAGLSPKTGHTVLANPTVTTDYTITGTSTAGCINTTKITVTVNPKPTVSFSLPSSACLGNNAITLSGTPSGGTFSGVGVSGNTFVSSQAGTGSFNITYSYTDNNGCSNSAQNTITVNPLPKADAGHDVTICGGSTNLSASGGSSYSWSPATGLSCTNCPDPIASPSTTTKYTVTVTGANGCSKDASVKVNIATSITANAGSDSSICNGKSTMLNASGGTGYSWHPTSGLSNPNIANPIASPSTTTTYTVNVTSGTCTPDSGKVTITVNPLPHVPTITANGTTLKSSSATGNQWYMNGNILPGETSQFYTVLHNGFYSVCVTTANGCSACSQDTSTTGINENSFDNGISIFPNPTEGKFILYTSINHRRTEIMIFSLLGKKVYSATLIEDRMEIDMSSQPKGTYFLELRNESGVFNKKIVIE